MAKSESGAALERAAYRLATAAHTDHRPGRRGRCLRCHETSPCAAELDAQRIFSAILGADSGMLLPEETVPRTGAQPPMTGPGADLPRPRHARRTRTDWLLDRVAGRNPAIM